jgi:hypothetical protein
VTVLCLATNVLLDGNVQLSATQVAQITDCFTGYIAVQSVDYVSLSTLGTLFQQYFAFDELLFAQLTGEFILVFSSGHIIGRIIGVMRKSF